MKQEILLHNFSKTSTIYVYYFIDAFFWAWRFKTFSR